MRTKPKRYEILARVGVDMKIRRLTPRECERLMSWPDDWTRWGIDEKGNTIEISDTQRYKMAGNGVVSNVVEWLIEPKLLLPAPLIAKRAPMSMRSWIILRSKTAPLM